MLTIEHVRDSIKEVGDVSISNEALQRIIDACQVVIDCYAPQPDDGSTLDYQAALDDYLIQLVILRLGYDALRSMRDGSYSQTREDYESERTRIITEIQTFSGVPIA